MQNLFLLPNILHEDSPWRYTPPSIDALIAESERGGYTFLKRMGLPRLPVYLLNEHTQHLDDLLNIPEMRVGLISDAGLPCIADPGANLVAAAHKKGVIIEAIPGPSSILMALQLSGLTGQTFTFHGYFPREQHEFTAQMVALPKGVSHIFIETPYRFEKIVQWLLASLHSSDLLCLATELMGPSQKVETASIQAWKQNRPLSGKHRTVFIIYKK